jgi:predicted amidophosphoribosyltransferase
MKRGYNQSEKLAQNLAEKLGLSFNSKLIIRNRNTIPQFKLKKEEKEKNIAGAFSLNPKYKGKMSGKSIFR